MIMLGIEIRGIRFSIGFGKRTNYQSLLVSRHERLIKEREWGI